ncbi:MAG TPA: asparaginase [Streptosporangiaceae bacterium]|nr:asparaginase [Streptosporangiaceae bacterium]
MTGQRRPLILIISCGGTISSVRSPGDLAGATPRLGAADLVADLPELGEIAEIRTHTFSTVPSSDLTLDDVLALRDLIDDRVLRSPELDGVVVTQGTDTLEEAAFALDLLWDGRCPVVVTGAMRNASMPGSDGPANLLAAVATAISPRANDAGVLVVAGDEIHAAAYVRKTHTHSPAAFRSPTLGPLGYVIENEAHLALLPRRRPRLAGLPRSVGPSPVALVAFGMGDDARLLDAVLRAGYRGAVIEAMGGGHLPGRVATSDELEALVDAMPVVLSSRAGSGQLLRSTYSFTGSESDLLARGLISSGVLDGRKARVLLSLLLAGPATRAEIERAFAFGP